MKKILTTILLFTIIFTTNSFAESLTVKVSESKAIYGDTLITSPNQTYTIKERRIPYQCRNKGGNSGDEFFGTLGSMALGGLIGSQFGGGSGKDIATFVGIVGGANHAESARHGTCHRIEKYREYTTTYTKNYSYGIIGYKNCAYIGKQKVCSKLTEHKEEYIIFYY